MDVSSRGPLQENPSPFASIWDHGVALALPLFGEGELEGEFKNKQPSVRIAVLALPFRKGHLCLEGQLASGAASFVPYAVAKTLSTHRGRTLSFPREAQ